MISVGPQAGAGASPVDDEHAHTVVKRTDDEHAHTVVKTTDVTIEVRGRATVSS